jgi:signal transduction histidine kinase
MGGAGGLAVLSIVSYFARPRPESAAAAVVAAILAVSGTFWAARQTDRAFGASLVIDTGILVVWVWLMGGLVLGVGAVFAWVILAGSLGLGPEVAVRLTLLALFAVIGLGVAHLVFATTDFDRDTVILLNLVFSAAILLPTGLAMRAIGRAAREANLERASARLRLAELWEMREEFLSNVSFEMRGPLTAVKGFTATLLESWETLDDADRVRFLQIVSRQSDKLTRLIQTMVDFAQLDSGTLKLVSEPFNLSDVIGLMRSQVNRANPHVDLLIDCSDDLWAVGDPDRLREMLADVVENAIIHGRPPIEIVALRHGERVEIAVADAGPGVPADKRPLLFERRDGAVTVAVDTRGLGLSLAHSRELAVAMGGEVRYEERRKGACFIVALPATDAPPSRVEGVPVPLRLLGDVAE